MAVVLIDNVFMSEENFFPSFETDLKKIARQTLQEQAPRHRLLSVECALERAIDAPKP